MSFLTRLGVMARAGWGALNAPIERREGGGPLENPSMPLGGPGFWAWLFSGESTESGEQINDFTALQQATVYSCVRIISESIASLPLKIYERLDKGRQEAINHRLYSLLRYAPNPEMTAFTFFESMAGSLCLTGNCYAQIVRNKLGAVAGIYPLHPQKTEPVRLRDGSLAYRTSDGEALGKSRYLPPEAVLHIPLFSFDGLKGLSPVSLQRQLIGGAKASEKFGARFFGNGSKPGGILHPSTGAKTDEKTISQVRNSWQVMQAGINQGKVAVLPGDWTYQQIGLSPEDSQFLETRKYNRTDICAIFRVPPHMAGDTTRLSNGNHEQQSLQFVTDTLRPYVCRFEQEIERKLVPQAGRNAGKYFSEFDVRERLRGDFATTMSGYALGRQWGWFSVNDILEDMGDNPVGPEGDIRLAPVNMVNLEKLLPGNGGGAGDEPGVDGGAGEVLTEKNGLRFALAYIAMFRDAVGRVCKRESRDLALISSVFEPVLTSLAVQLGDVCGANFGLEGGWTDPSKVVSDQVLAIEKRASGWQLGDTENIAMQELQRILRGMAAEMAERAGRAAAKEI